MDTTPNQEVSQEAPVEDRLAALFAQEETEVEAPVEDTAEEAEETEGEAQEDESAEAETSEEEVEEVEFEGKAYKVPKELKPALLRQADYTKKTQELAEYRKQVADQNDYLAAQRHLLSTAGQEFAELKAAELELAKFQNVNWAELANQNPGQAIVLSKQQEQITRFVEQKRAKLAEMGQHAERITKEHKSVQWQAAVEATKRAVGKVPPEVDAKALQMVQSAFTPEEMHKLADANILQWAIEAAQWRLLQESKPGLNKRAETAKPVKSVSRSAPQAQIAGKAALARQQLKKTGNSNAAEAYLESLFARRK